VAHSQYGGGTIEGVTFNDLAFTVDDLKLMGTLTKALLVGAVSFVLLEPSVNQCNEIVELGNQLIGAVNAANKELN
jgi:hypothetical protein